MFKRKIKVNDIVVVYPHNARVRVINIMSHSLDVTWLKNYWKTKYDMKLPIYFNIAVCRYATNSNKNYNFPITKMCLKKPWKQKKARKIWVDDRDHFKAMTNKDKLNESIRQYRMVKKNDFFR